MDDNILKIKKLVNELNVYRNAYYNESKSIISDYQYDTMFDELKELEDKTGFIMSNSPTQNVGYEPVSKFEKVTHITPMLSLDKTQDINKFVEFCNKHSVLLMHKLDGLTIRLTYDNGELITAETRGDGIKGDIITNNAKCFDNVPLTITNKNHIVLTGEAIITKDVFESIKKNNPNNDYKNPRNLASGTVKQLNPNIVKERHIKFVVWNANDLSTDGTMWSGLEVAEELGFNVVSHYIPVGNLNKTVPDIIDKLKTTAESNFLPIDGIVAVYNDISYGESLGRTSHHFNNGFAFKFYDEEEVTTLREIEWSMGKTGDLTPVAIFDPVEIDGTTVTRASLHNVSILKELELGIGDYITVYKANMIIPQIRKNLTKSNTLVIRNTCPVCGEHASITTSINGDKVVEVLTCDNPNCSGKLLGKLSHYVSKSAMNIDGLSEATIEKFMELGFINSILDIYKLSDHKFEISILDGFGEVSVNKLLKAIENSKTTTLDRFLNALSIPTIGTSNAKVLANYIDNDINRIWELGTNNLTVINGIGPEMNTAIHNWFNPDNIAIIEQLIKILSFTKPTKPTSAKFVNINFVITGKLNKYKNRSDLESTILHNGGTIQSAVSSNTNYLINNDINSNSSKNKKAKELNIPIITEDEFIKLLGTDTTVTAEIQPTNLPKNDGVKKKLF